MALFLSYGIDLQNNEKKIKDSLNASLKRMDAAKLAKFSERITQMVSIANDAATEELLFRNYGVSKKGPSGEELKIEPHYYGPETNPDKTEVVVPTGYVSSPPPAGSTGPYFEYQDSAASCGRHALNNMLGRPAFYLTGGTIVNDTDRGEPINLPSVCEYLQSKIPILPFGCSPNENYDFSTLHAALNIVGFRSTHSEAGYGIPVIRPGVTGPIDPEMKTIDEFKTDLSTYRYGLINRGPTGDASRGHWISVRKDGTGYYYFDSLDNDTPPLVGIDDPRISDFRKAYVFEDTGKFINPLDMYSAIRGPTGDTGSTAPPTSGTASAPASAPPPTSSKYTNDKSVWDEFDRLKGEKAKAEIKPTPKNLKDKKLWTNHKEASAPITALIKKGDFTDTAGIDKLLTDAVSKLKVFIRRSPGTRKGKPPGGGKRTTYRRSE